MNKYILFFIFIINCAASSAGTSIRLNNIQANITLDGAIDDAWSMADSTSDFVQVNPYFGRTPTYKTTAKILTNGTALFCLYICEVPAGRVQTLVTPFDNADGDHVNLFLDPFRDKTNAYRFDVNSAGQRSDAVMTDDARNTDFSWDGVWFAAARVYEDRYIVEMEIPFKSIRYSKNVTDWGIDFQRWVPDKMEDLSWSRYSREEEMRVSKFNTMLNVRPAESGLSFEAYPVGIVRLEKERQEPNSTRPDIGLDLKWNPRPEFGLSLTANPDFAQIEADPSQVNLTKYELYYDERRPFFMDGAEIFGPIGKESNGFYSPLEFIYSRRIGKKLQDGSEVPIYGGGKIAGKSDGWEYGGLMAYTGGKNAADADNGAKITENEALFGVARLKKSLFENSTVGMLFAGKSSSGKGQSVLAIDGAYRKSNFQWSMQLGKSFGENGNGFAFSSGARYLSKDMLFQLRSRWIDKDFNVSEVGYVPWRGTGRLGLISGPTFRYETGMFRSIVPYAGMDISYESGEKYVERSMIAGISFQFRTQLGLEMNMSLGKAKEQETIFNYSEYSASFWGWYGQAKSFNLYLNRYYGYNYNMNDFGWTNDITLTGAYAINTRFSTELRSETIWEYRKGNSLNDVYYMFRPMIVMALHKDIHLRLYVDNLIKNSSGRLERCFFGGLLSYNFSPKSWIYLAYNDLMESRAATGAVSRYSLESLSKIMVLKVKYLYYM